jgi:uncharacterized protein
MKKFTLVWFILPLVFCCTPSGGQHHKSEIIQFNSGGVFLEGRLDLPTSKGKFPLLIFVHGSGRRTRADYDEFVVPFLQNGFATFRYDKRGVGNSMGTYADVDVGTDNSPTTIHTLARDVIAAVKKLKHNASIDSARCILVGASQAGWIIPLAATLENIYLTAIFSGPSVSVGEEIYYSSLAENGDYTVAEANKMVLSYQGTKGFDPIPYLGRITKPSLWIFGKEDESIPVDRSIQLLKQVRDKYALPIQIQVVPGVNHSMRSKDGKVADYVSRTLNWILEQQK